MIIGVTLVAALFTFFATYLMTEKYETVTLLLVKPQQEITLTSGKDRKLLDFPVTAGTPMVETPSKTSIEIIKSRAIAERVVRRLGLDGSNQQNPAAGRPDHNKVKELLGACRDWVKGILRPAVQVLKYGRVIGKKTAFEQAVEDFQEGISLHATRETYLFEILYESEDPNEAAAVANGAAEAFLEYMAGNSRAEANRAVAFIEGALHEKERELEERRHALREFKERNKIVSFEEETAEQIKLLSELEGILEKTETKLAGLLKQYAFDHPKVQSALAEKEHLRALIDTRKHTQKRLPDIERQLASLKVDVDIAETAYRLIHKEYEEAQIREANKTGEFMIVSPAAPPMYPSKPKRIRYIATAVTLGLLIGIGLAFFRENMNTTIRNIDQAETLLHLRVLATIPRAK
jgi:tyrosine-protein kinase Etk/Wzc